MTIIITIMVIYDHKYNYHQYCNHVYNYNNYQNYQKNHMKLSSLLDLSPQSVNLFNLGNCVSWLARFDRLTAREIWPIFTTCLRLRDENPRYNCCDVALTPTTLPAFPIAAFFWLLCISTPVLFSHLYPPPPQ